MIKSQREQIYLFVLAINQRQVTLDSLEDNL